MDQLGVPLPAHQEGACIAPGASQGQGLNAVSAVPVICRVTPTTSNTHKLHLHARQCWQATLPPGTGYTANTKSGNSPTSVSVPFTEKGPGAMGLSDTQGHPAGPDLSPICMPPSRAQALRHQGARSHHQQRNKPWLSSEAQWKPKTRLLIKTVWLAWISAGPPAASTLSLAQAVAPIS